MNPPVPTSGLDKTALFEYEGRLVFADNDGKIKARQAKIPLYPSIIIKTIRGRQVDHVGPVPTQYQSPWDKLYTTFIQEGSKFWEQYHGTVESTSAFKLLTSVYEFAQSYSTTLTPPTITDHPLFTSPPSANQCISWHPHLPILALAHRDLVYVYEKNDETWSCTVLQHETMTGILSMEWKRKAGGSLAIGCQRGVYVWNLLGSEEPPLTFNEKAERVPLHHVPSVPPSTRFQAYASVRFFSYPGHEMISSVSWDSSLGSHLLVAASAVTNTLVIYDTLSHQPTVLKRYGSGNFLTRWSPNGEWLYVASMSGTSRLWKTHNWTSTELTNPPGLWVQAACWAPDSRSLFYSMRGKSDVHVLYRSSATTKAGMWNLTLISLPSSEMTLASGEKVIIGGEVSDLSMDPYNGQRLAIAHESSPLVTLYEIKAIPLTVNTKVSDQHISLFGFMRAAEMRLDGNTVETTPRPDAKPLRIAYRPSCPNGAMLATVWDNHTISFLPQRFTTEAERHRRHFEYERKTAAKQ